MEAHKNLSGPQAPDVRHKQHALAQLRAVVDNIVDGIITIGAHGNIESFNPACERIFGYTEQEVIGHNIKILMPEPYQSEHDQYLQNYHATGIKKIIGIGREVAARRKDGSVFPIDLAVSVFELEDGKHFAGIIRDITARKRAEQAKALLAAIVESSGDAIISKNQDGIITSWNEAAERLFGYTADEAVGRDLSLIIPVEHRDEDDQIIAEIETGKGVRHLETQRRHKNGHLIDVLLTVSPVRDISGRIVGASKILRDITERKQAESERKGLLDRLTHSNEELERFAYVASHDLKEPLRMVTSFIDLLQKRYDGRLDERAQGYITFVKEGGERMHQLVDSLLEYARTGKQEERTEQVDCNQVIKIVKSNLAMQIAESQAEIKCDKLPVVHANTLRMSMLLQNLISNGIKYQAKDASPIITIRCEDKEGYWLFSVKDNGIGMKEEYLTKIFEPFKRLHTTEHYRGTGIGLAISLKIVESWGGKIWAASKLGKGSTIYFKIPKVLQ